MSGTCNTSSFRAETGLGALTGMVVRWAAYRSGEPLRHRKSGNCRACARLGQLSLRRRLSLSGRGRAPVSPPANLGHDWSCRRYGIDSQREAIDLAHDAAFSGGNRDGGDGVPQFAVYENFSGRRERGLRELEFADESLFAGDNL